MKHRVGNFLKGIGFFIVVIGVYLGNLFLWGEIVGWGWWLFFVSFTIMGIVLIAKGIVPIKYELRRCVYCGISTEQFEKKRELKKNQSNYVCEKCGNENIVSLCKTCRKPMDLVDDKGEQWYCAKDQIQFLSKDNRTVEHVLLDSEKSLPERETRSETKPNDEKKSAESKKKTKYCRECGASIPRDSTFCEKCGAKLG